MKYIIFIILFLAIAISGCDTELGHTSHDHDGDGIEDHAPEDHDEHHEDEHDEGHDNHMGE